MKTVAVDFDGVIHAYSKGWQDGSCYDDPMPAAIYGLKALMELYSVFILSTRDPEQIAQWMQKHAPEIETEVIQPLTVLFWQKPGVLGITNRKLPAMAYIDDRSYLFKDWKTVVADKSIFVDYPKGIQ